jgi:hypothetical protein
MTIITHKVTLQSELGDAKHPATLELRMDETKPDCPVTFWQNDKAVFSMGNDEIHDFIKALSYLDCSGT